MLEDVPSPIDYRVMSEAREWEATAMEKRPWRTEIFERFVSENFGTYVTPSGCIRSPAGLATGRSYLLCDHFAGEGGMTNDQLYMSVEEQQSALRRAGFTEVEVLLLKGGLYSTVEPHTPCTSRRLVANSAAAAERWALGRETGKRIGDVGSTLRRAPSLGEEVANCVSHGVGALAALVATPFLILAAAQRGGLVAMVGASVFAGTVVALYFASTLYHALPSNKAKRVFG